MQQSFGSTTCIGFLVVYVLDFIEVLAVIYLYLWSSSIHCNVHNIPQMACPSQHLTYQQIQIFASDKWKSPHQQI